MTATCSPGVAPALFRGMPAHFSDSEQMEACYHMLSRPQPPPDPLVLQRLPRPSSLLDKTQLHSRCTACRVCTWGHVCTATAHTLRVPLPPDPRLLFPGLPSMSVLALKPPPRPPPHPSTMPGSALTAAYAAAQVAGLVTVPHAAGHQVRGHALAALQVLQLLRPGPEGGLGQGQAGSGSMRHGELSSGVRALGMLATCRGLSLSICPSIPVY